MSWLSRLFGDDFSEGQLPAGTYNRVIGVHGQRGSGKSMLGASLLAACPGWKIVVGRRFPTLLPDGTKLKTVAVKRVVDVRRAVTWNPDAIVVCTEGQDYAALLAGPKPGEKEVAPPKDTVCEKALAVAIGLSKSSAPRNGATYTPTTVLIDEAARWGSVRAGYMSDAMAGFLAECRHIGVGVIYLTQTPRWLDEKLFSLSTDIYSFRTTSLLDIRRLRLSGEYTEDELTELGDLDDFEAYHKKVGAREPGEFMSLPSLGDDHKPLLQSGRCHE